MHKILLHINTLKKRQEMNCNYNWMSAIKKGRTWASFLLCLIHVHSSLSLLSLFIFSLFLSLFLAILVSWFSINLWFTRNSTISVVKEFYRHKYNLNNSQREGKKNILSFFLSFFFILNMIFALDKNQQCLEENICA